MGCGCRGHRIGTDPTNPFPVGVDDGSPPRRVTALVNGFGIRRNTIGWVVGADVDASIEAGWLQVAA